MKTLIEGAILAVIVVFMFLRDWRATLVAAIALPLSIIPAFWAMDCHGLLAQPRQPARPVAGGRHPGRRRHRRDREHRAPPAHGQDRPIAAALEAADEIGLAVIAITFTHHRRVRAGRASWAASPASSSSSSAWTVGVRGVLLAAGGAADHADDGRLFPARDAPRSEKEGWLLQRLHAAGALVGARTASDAWRSGC